MNIKNLTLIDVAKLGLYADDPYGDGIRLEHVRNPSAGRLDAITLIYENQFPIDGGHDIMIAYQEKIKMLFNKRTGELKKDSVELNLI